MKIRFLPYFLRQALINIMNNRVVHAISLGTMITSMLIFGAFLILFVNLNAWVQGWGHSLSMSVYLQDGISEADRAKVASFIQVLPSAEIKSFTSKEKALNDLRGALGAHAGLLEGLSFNPLPASFEVVFKGPVDGEVSLQKIKENLEKEKGVEEVNYSQEWIKRFEGLMRIVKLSGIIVVGLLCLGVLFIVTNTIKLTIYLRKDEIEILRLVGASEWFVKTPFLLEGMIQGILAGAFSILILFSGYFVLSTKKLHFLNLAVLDFTFIPYSYVISILLISLFLGLVGSFVAVGRFFDI